MESLDEDDVKIMYQKRKKKRNEMSIYLFVNVGAVLCAFYDGIRSQKFFDCLVSNFLHVFLRGCSLLHGCEYWRDCTVVW